MTAIPQLPVRTLARMIRDRELSATELVEQSLAVIDTANGELNALVTLTGEEALQRAQWADRIVLTDPDALGPLHGVPVAIKDNTDTAGIRTTYGSRIFESNVPERDALVVSRLLEAGAIVIGKTNTPEFAVKGTTDNPLFGTTTNPWNTKMTPFGSSGGAGAAVASGMAPLAQGTDVAGSVRLPASACNIIGFKPSPGVIPRRRLEDAWDHTDVDGFLAHSADDISLVITATSGTHPEDPISLPSLPTQEKDSLDSLRCGWSPDLGYVLVDQEVRAITEVAAASLEQLGHQVEGVQLDLSPYDPENLFLDLWRPVQLSLRDTHLPHSRDLLDPIVAMLLEREGDDSIVAHRRAQSTQAMLWATMSDFFSSFDILITPTVAIPPFPVGLPPPTTVNGVEMRYPFSWYGLTFPFNLIGLPAISIPAGWTESGLPVGLQMVGPRLSDAMLIEVARGLEQQGPWRRDPPRFDN